MRQNQGQRLMIFAGVLCLCATLATSGGIQKVPLLGDVFAASHSLNGTSYELDMNIQVGQTGCPTQKISIATNTGCSTVAVTAIACVGGCSCVTRLGIASVPGDTGCTLVAEYTAKPNGQQVPEKYVSNPCATHTVTPCVCGGFFAGCIPGAATTPSCGNAQGVAPSCAGS